MTPSLLFGDNRSNENQPVQPLIAPQFSVGDEVNIVEGNALNVKPVLTTETSRAQSLEKFDPQVQQRQQRISSILSHGSSVEVASPEVMRRTFSKSPSEIKRKAQQRQNINRHEARRHDNIRKTVRKSNMERSNSSGINSRAKSTLSKSQLSKTSVRSPDSKTRNKFEKSYGQRLEATLVGTSDIDNMNKDLVDVTKDLASLLRKSKQVAEQEKSKATRQLSSIKSRGSSSRAFVSGAAFKSGKSGEKFMQTHGSRHFSRHMSGSDFNKIVGHQSSRQSRRLSKSPGRLGTTESGNQ